MQDVWDSHAGEGERGDQYAEPRDARRAVQKRTFTRWMNVFLQRCDPPMCVDDLFTDIQDGRILMGLLEELCGCKLLYRFRSSPHRIFRLSNISKALAFLDDRHVKLLGIDASGVADGIPAVVLHLVWNVILHFQIKEVTAGLRRSLSLSSLSMSGFPSSDDFSPREKNFSSCTLPSKGRRPAAVSKFHGKTIKTILQWVQRCTSKHGIAVHDFGKSWTSGLAFLAMMKSMNPDLVDLRSGLTREPKENMQQAFKIAQECLDIPALLDPEDVISVSDQKSILTYVSMFLGRDLAQEKARTHTFQVPPEMPNFGLSDSLSYGQTLADDAEAQALLKGMQQRNEQLLWKRWSNGSTACKDQSSSPLLPRTSHPSAVPHKVGRGGRALQLPSPLDAVVDGPDIQSWLEMNGTRRDDEMCLSPLDSDEEEAYSYILHLNKEASEPNYQSKRQIPKIEEGAATEVIKQLETCETLSGKRERLLAQGEDCESIDWKFDLNAEKREFKEEANNHGKQNLESEAERRRRNKEEVVLDEGQSNDDGCNDEEARERKIGNGRSGVDESEDSALKREMDDRGCWRRDGEDKGHKVQLHNCELTGEGKTPEEEGRELQSRFSRENKMKTWNMKSIEAGKGRKNPKRDNSERFQLETDNRLQSLDNVVSEDLSRFGHFKEGEVRNGDAEDIGSETKKKRRYRLICTGSGDSVHVNTTDETDCTRTFSSNSAPQSLSSGTELALRSLASICDITPLELELLFVLWIVLYCCLILPQLNL